MERRTQAVYKKWILFLLFIVGLMPRMADATPNLVETGRLLAILLDAGRVTIGLNQALINDPSKGNKGFTSEVFEKQVINLFQERTGVNLANLQSENVPETAKPLLARLLEESKKTVDSYQPVINILGFKYKGLIPATFGTETAKRFQNWSRVYLKQTAPDRFLRNPENKADQYESRVMDRLSDPSSTVAKNSVHSEIVEGEDSVRIMLPLFYRKECLNCHGGPKGERDISGYTKEGGREGELAGAISVKLSLSQE